MSDAHQAVFLSYASQDAEAAKRICDALRAAGVEVWFDQSELRGGDSWDAKIRRQIKECALFVPVISANTQARTEGYFRLEWRLADQRTHLMGRNKTFLMPVCVDTTPDADADVPDSFSAVQWTKLAGGETPPAFAARVKNLLDSSDMEAGRPRPAARGAGFDQASPRTENRRLGRWWWALPMFGVMMAMFLIMKEGRKEPAPVSAAPPALSSPAVGLSNPPNGFSEAQKLVAQARKIYEDGDELNRENLFLAEELVQRALKLDPAEPAAWELSTWLSYLMVWHLIDESPARRETLLRQANRALALAPESVSAQLVYANAQLAGRFMVRAAGQSHLEETEQSLQRLAERAPQDWRVPRALGTVYRLMNRTDDAISALTHALELSGDNPMAVADLVNVYIRRQRLPEAEALLARTLPHRRSGRLLTFDVVVKCRWRSDAAGALRAIETWPAWLLQEDRGLALAWQAGYWGHQPEAALRVVQQFPREEVRDLNFSGPRAVLSARAHEMAGDAAAAQADWRTVLQRCDQALGTDSHDVIALHWKAWALARLGDQAGAQAAATLLRQHMRSVASGFFNVNTVAPLWATVGWTDLALSELRALLETPVDGYSLTRAYLEMEPAFDPIRQDPRFIELVAAALAPPTPLAASSSLSLSPSTLSVADSKSVAVLAFANLSDDKANEYFSDGISEELLNVLAKIPGLKVSARTSAFYFKGKEVPVPEIAQQLGVAYVVEGSVRKQGTKVRITAQLIKAADGFHVWSDTFTRELKDIFAVQDEIAGLIAQQLQLKLGGEAVGVKKVVNPEAYRLVLEGRHFLAPRTSAGFEQADRAFTQALKIDPQFALAQAGLATTTALRGRYRLLDGLGHVEEFDQLAITQSRLALEMDPTQAEPHATIGFIYTDTGQLAEAEQEFRLAIAANPNYATAYHWHSHVLASTGRLDLALKEIGRAEALDPVSFIIQFIHGFYLSDAHRYAEALAALDRAAAIRGESFLPLESDRARVLLALGRRDEALTAARRILQDPRLISSGWYAAGEALYVLKQGGAAGEADRLAQPLLQAMPEGSYQRGYVLCAIGRFTEGMQALVHIPDIVRSRLYWHPMLDPVRDTPEFRQMLEEFKTVEEYKVARATLAGMLKEQEAKQ